MDVCPMMNLTIHFNNFHGKDFFDIFHIFTLVAAHSGHCVACARTIQGTCRIGAGIQAMNTKCLAIRGLASVA